MGGGLYDTRSDTGAAVLGRSPRGGGSVGRPGGDPMDQYCCNWRPPARRRGRQTGWNTCWTASGGCRSPRSLPSGRGRHSGDWPAARRWIRPPGSMGCSTSCFPPAGAGAWDLRLRRRHCGAWNGWHRPWCWQTRWAEVRQRPNSGAAGLCPHRRPPQGFLPGGADAGYLGLRPPLGWSGGDRLTGTAPCNMKK